MGIGEADVVLGIFEASIRLTTTFDPTTGPTCVILKADADVDAFVLD